MGKKKRGKRPRVQFPIATFVEYGPDDKTVTKIAVGILPRPGAEDSALERWVGPDVASDPAVAEEIMAFLKSHGVQTVLRPPCVFGCPHEEGVDFPEGGDCPHCPFWRGKQGSGAAVEQRWANLGELEIYSLRRGESPFDKPRRR